MKKILLFLLTIFFMIGCGGSSSTEVKIKAENSFNTNFDSNKDLLIEGVK